VGERLPAGGVRRGGQVPARGPAAVLVVAAIGVVFLPHLGPAVEAGAVRFQDQAAYNATVLSGAHVAHPAAAAR
jgi:hypothetical protein